MSYTGLPSQTQSSCWPSILLVELGYLCFLTGMNKGGVTLTGVIGGSFPAVTTVLALVFFHESITGLELLAIGVILLGIILSPMQGTFKDILKGVRTSGTIFAFGAFILWGVYFALIRIPIESVGWFLPQYFSTIAGVALYYVLSKITKDTDMTSRPRLVWLIIAAAVTQVVGSSFFNYAISRGETSIVAPIAGSSPAVFVIIAFFVFREELNKKQWAGIALAITGIVGLSLLGG